MIISSAFFKNKMILFLSDKIDKLVPFTPESKLNKAFLQSLVYKYLKSNIQFKSILMKDNNNNYYVIDGQLKIKVLFSKRNIKQSLNKKNVYLLLKRQKIMIIDVNSSMFDIRLVKVKDKKIFCQTLLIIEEFKLEEENNNINNLLFGDKRKDINSNEEIFKKLNELLEVMKKNNSIGDKNIGEGESWFISGKRVNDVFEMKNIEICKDGVLGLNEKKITQKKEKESIHKANNRISNKEIEKNIIEKNEIVNLIKESKFFNNKKRGREDKEKINENEIIKEIKKINEKKEKEEKMHSEIIGEIKEIIEIKNESDKEASIEIDSTSLYNKNDN